jgi:hypothetical protein
MTGYIDCCSYAMDILVHEDGVGRVAVIGTYRLIMFGVSMNTKHTVQYFGFYGSIYSTNWR